ncbi:hypothetical protein EGW08_002575, partial [Elysia chlorotica]
MKRISTFSNTIFSLVLLILNVFPVWTEKTFFDIMDRQCGKTILLTSLPTKSLVLVLTEQTEYAPLFDWYVTVTVPEGARISLGFLEMDIRSFGACPGDFLTIIDSQQITEDSFHFQDPSMRRYCGAQTPQSLTSTGNNITIRFVSDHIISGRGFSLLLTAFHE